MSCLSLLLWVRFINFAALMDFVLLTSLITVKLYITAPIVVISAA